MKRIRFIPSSASAMEHIPMPSPIKKHIPEWYKKAEYAIDNKTYKKTSDLSGDISGGLKSCIPFLDVMLSGYVMETWESIEIYENSGNSFRWRYVENNPYTDDIQEKININVSMIGEREGDSGHTIPRPAGHRNNHMIWKGQWGVRVPRGWSLLMTHPFNRWDLPFTTTSGIIDSDEWWTSGNIPFFFKDQWLGVIPKGTPFCQLIPIKRSSWSAYPSVLSMSRYKNLSDKVSDRTTMGWYKKNIWVRKKYD